MHERTIDSSVFVFVHKKKQSPCEEKEGVHKFREESQSHMEGIHGGGVSL